MWWEVPKTGLMLLFAWLAVRTAWLDWTLPPDIDGTPLMSFLVYGLWPASLLVIWVVVGDLRKLHDARGTHRALAIVRVIVGLTALGALFVQVVAWAL